MKTTQTKNNKMRTGYSGDQLESIRGTLAEYWIDEMPEDALKEVLLKGCKGYEKMDEENLVEEFEEIFGEEHFDND